MLRWLYAISENQFLKERVSSLEGEANDLKTRLYAEIDGNRLREDALVRLIAQNPAVAPPNSTPHIPSRANIQVTREESPDEEDFTVRYGDVDERWVQQRADDYIKAAEAYGGYDDREALCEEIRKNPQLYLIN